MESILNKLIAEADFAGIKKYSAYDHAYENMLNHIIVCVQRNHHPEEIIKNCRATTAHPEPTDTHIGGDEAITFYERLVEENTQGEGK